jgi:hypothetical protein
MPVSLRNCNEVCDRSWGARREGPHSFDLIGSPTERFLRMKRKATYDFSLEIEERC